jgi:Family of unknown function (DUF6282)
MTDPRTRGTGLYSSERLEELSGGGWLLRFMEQFPQVRQVQRGVEEVCLQGAIDMHVHADPCSLMPRNQDFTQVAIDAARAGLRAVVRKDHFYSTVGEAYAVQRHVDYLVETGVLPRRIEVYGGVPLQSLEPAQIERALRQPQFKMIWCNPVGGEALVRDGVVRPEMERILRLAAEHGLALNLGQPSHSAAKNPDLGDYDGLAPLCERIRELGVKAVLDHPLSSFNADQIEALSGGSVFAGLFCYPTLPSVIKAPVVDPARTLELVKRLGPRRCLIASDVGMLLEPTQLEAYRLMIRLLIVLGFSQADVSVMIKDNPAHLLGLNGKG